MAQAPLDHDGHHAERLIIYCIIVLAPIKGSLVGALQSHSFLDQEFMILLTKRLAALVSVAILSSLAVAKTNPECLNHLGGGYGDAECYQGLSADIAAENKRLYKSIKATIPAKNGHAMLLDEYMKAQDDSIRYCELQRDSGDGWDTKHDGSMYPAIYQQCIYDGRKAQNEFLKNILTMTKW